MTVNRSGQRGQIILQYRVLPVFQRRFLRGARQRPIEIGVEVLNRLDAHA